MHVQERGGCRGVALRHAVAAIRRREMGAPQRTTDATTSVSSDELIVE